VTGIAEMFAELDGRDRYDLELARLFAWQRATRNAKSVERMRRWRKQNPDKMRAQSRRGIKRWRDRFKANDPDGFRAWSNAKQRRYRERNRDRVRASWRRNSAAYAARKREAA
jgi:hypothetical protein